MSLRIICLGLEHEVSIHTSGLTQREIAAVREIVDCLQAKRQPEEEGSTQIKLKASLPLSFLQNHKKVTVSERKR